MSEAPAFQWHPKDRDHDLAPLSMPARAAVMALAGYVWLRGAIPLDMTTSELAGIARIPDAAMKRAWPELLRHIFTIRVDGGYSTPWIEEQRKERRELHARRSQNGREGNAKRWGEHRQAISERSPSDTGAIANGSQPGREQDRKPVANDRPPYSILHTPDSIPIPTPPTPPPDGGGWVEFAGEDRRERTNPIDEDFAEFRRRAAAAGVLPGSEPEWRMAQRYWRALDGEQRMAALASIEQLQGQMVLSSMVATYVRLRKWERPQCIPPAACDEGVPW